MLISAFVVAFTAVALLTSCSSDEESVDEAASEVEETAEAPTAPELLASAGERLASASDFRFDFDQENGTTEILSGIDLVAAQGVVVPPARLAAELDVEVSALSIDMSAIGIDDTVWITNPFDPDRWEEVPGQAASDLFDLGRLPEVLAAVADPELAGTAERQGETVWRITASVDSGLIETILPPAAEPGQQVEIEIWVTEADRTPARVVLAGPLRADEPAEIVRTLTLSELDAGATVEPPPS